MDKDAVILIAEDDKGHAGLIMRNLKRSGLDNEMLHFNDGEKILDFFFNNRSGHKREENVPYVLLLDIRMPKADGIEVLRRVKQDDEYSKIPVIMISTTDEENTIEQCCSLGCDDYIVKPIDPDDFRKKIKGLGQSLQLL